MDREERFKRQLDVVHPDKLAALQVTIIGCGAVGSFTCFTLAKMGVTNITIYDADIVAEHNLPNQLFNFEQVGIPKVDAIANTVYYQAQVDLNAIPHHYTRQPLRGIVICCVDTMDTRLKLWREVKKYNPDLYLDARMGAEVGKILAVQPSDPNSRRKYEEDLYPSSEAFQAPCTAKATVYCAAGLAAYICSMVAGYVNGRKVEGLVVDWVSLSLNC